jgi:uncharacterized glyoxalase superfamily protein PhnB
MTTTPPPQVWPTLRSTDARALIRFLVDTFGFEETVVYGEGDRVDHAELSWPPGGGVMLGSARADGPGQDGAGQDGAGQDGPVPPGMFSCYVVTDEPDALFARVKNSGARIVADPHDTDYGSRDFAAADPEGNRWHFGTYRGAPRGGHPAAPAGPGGG